MSCYDLKHKIILLNKICNKQNLLITNRYFCILDILKRTFQSGFRVQNHHWNYLFRVVNSQRLFCSKKSSWNIRFKAFWFTILKIREIIINLNLKCLFCAFLNISSPLQELAVRVSMVFFFSAPVPVVQPRVLIIEGGIYSNFLYVVCVSSLIF